MYVTFVFKMTLIWSLEWKSAVSKLVVPVREGPEGKQEDGAALPAVSQVKYEGFPTELLKGVRCLVQLFCSRFVTSSAYSRQTVFLCHLLCTDGLLVHGCHHIWQMKSHRAQNKARLVSWLSSFLSVFQQHRFQWQFLSKHKISVPLLYYSRADFA